MARKGSITRLSELTVGQRGDFFALLSEKHRGSTRENKPYYICRLRDAHRTVTWMVWQDSKFFAEMEKEWQPGIFFKVRGTYGEHPQYGPQLEVDNLRPIAESDRQDGFQEADFLDHSRYDPQAMLDELLAIAADEIRDLPLRQLTIQLLTEHAETLKRLPATQKHYYPFPGGWLEHTRSVTRNCLWLVDRYREHYADAKPALNRDLVLSGAMLHEIGRAVEFIPATEFGTIPEQSIPGRLFGHLFLGRDLIRDAAKSIEGMNPELLQLLEHIVVSHLTLPEWGSPRLPAIPEVLILHHADDLDAKLEMYLRCLKKDLSTGPFTERDPILGKPLLKRREQ